MLFNYHINLNQTVVYSRVIFLLLTSILWIQMTLKAEDCYLGKFYANELFFADGHKVEENWSKLKATNATLSWSFLDSVSCNMWTATQNDERKKEEKNCVFYAILKQSGFEEGGLKRVTWILQWYLRHYSKPVTGSYRLCEVIKLLVVKNLKWRWLPPFWNKIKKRWKCYFNWTIWNICKFTVLESF